MRTAKILFSECPTKIGSYPDSAKFWFEDDVIEITRPEGFVFWVDWEGSGRDSYQFEQSEPSRVIWWDDIVENHDNSQTKKKDR